MPWPHRATQGFTILEVLVASSISLLIFGLSTQSYLAFQASYNKQAQYSSFAEHLNFTLLLLHQQILQAGTTWCRNWQELECHNHAGFPLPTSNLQGYSYAAAQTIPYLAHRNLAPASDVLVLVKTTPQNSSLASPVQPSATELPLTAHNFSAPQAPLLIADCQHAELFTVARLGAHKITTNQALRYPYAARTTKVAPIERLAFFVSKASYRTPKNQAVYSLYYARNDQDKQELCPNISRMLVSYGLPSEGASLTYLTAPEVTRLNLWHQITHLKITLIPSRVPLAKQPIELWLQLRNHR